MTCRIGKAKRDGTSNRVHVCSEAHRVLVESYRERREVWLDARDAACIGYATEEREYGTGPTFRNFLLHR